MVIPASANVKVRQQILHSLTPDSITRWCILALSFAMLWPSATINYGGRGPQIASLWHQKCCGHHPQLTMMTKGHKWPLCDINLAKKWPIWRSTIIKKISDELRHGCRCGCGCICAWFRQLTWSKALHIFLLIYWLMASIKIQSKSQMYDNILIILYDQIPKGWGLYFLEFRHTNQNLC